MKASNKYSIITGAVLLALAALFSISMILLPLDFGAAGPGHNNILFLLGDMLYSVYGFSSILIPAFLLTASLSCFASEWTARKTMRFLTALVPFFTCVITENICRSIINLENTSFPEVKIAVTIVTGVMLVVIEYFAAGILADKIAKKNLKHKIKSQGYDDDFAALKQNEQHEQHEQQAPQIADSDTSDTKENIVQENSESKSQVFDEALSKLSKSEQKEEFSTNEDNTNSTPSSMITQEEFVALTEQPEQNGSVEELEWPDLPPPQQTLPPEYDADFDADDPALEFPPKEPEIEPKIEEAVAPEFEAYDVEEQNIDDNDSYDSYIEDETLPFPDIGIEEDDSGTDSFDIENDFESDLSDVYWNPAESAESEREIPQEAEDEVLETEKEIRAVKVEHASDVFSEMEAEIRASMDNQEDKLSHYKDKEDASQIKNDETKSETAEKKSSGVDLFGNPVSQSFVPDFEERLVYANNLTADELSDFFNAQQQESAPKSNTAVKKGPYTIPTDLLIAYKDDQYWLIDEQTKQAALNLKQTLGEFNIEAEIIGIKKGPVVTMFEILPAPGVKLSKIVALQDNIALSLAAQSVRIVAPIPGKQAVGIEVPNRHRSVVGFREIIEMNLPEWSKMAVPVILGKDILGKAQLIDLAKTPHMLIAGATGSGKSVCVNSLILSILYKRSFNDVKLILVDPKVVELKLYNSIPHLLTPVITEPKKALKALQWCLCEMERRYALLDSMSVRDIANYNQKINEQKICTEKLPYIVVIIDEFADLMATSGKELESIVARLTAMSRAVGIHLVLATQRPSVNVITGLIKANIPTRIAFMVASRTDSNIIIDTVGAEKLLGRGDMLYASAVDPAPIRIQGTFVTDQEVEDVVKAVKEYGEPDYLDEELFEDDKEDEARDLFGEPIADDDPLYDQALEIVVQAGKASASYIQRRLKIGYNRAARLVEEMEERGIVGPANGSKPREVIQIP